MEFFTYSPKVTSLVKQLQWSVCDPTSEAFPTQVLNHALSGDPKAMAIYGILLQTGSCGVIQDEALAMAWITSAASAPISDEPTGGHMELFELLRGNSPRKISVKKGKKVDLDEGFLRSDVPTPTCGIGAAQMAAILHILGDAYRRGIGCSTDLGRAFRLLQRASQLGHPEGLVALATMYERGDGVAQDQYRAFTLFFKSAELGDVYSMYKVGQALEKGQGTVVNYVQAKHWYRQATSRRHFPSLVRLAILSTDPRCESIEMLESAANRIKTPRSFYDFAASLATTQHGALPNPKEMRHWFRRAANAGYVKAQWLLGNAHMEAAKSDPKEYKKAFYWYHAAAVQGYQPAQWAVGNMYRLGQGIEQDITVADKWHKAASRSGMERCNSDPVDPAIITVHSLTESVAPIWNTAEGLRPLGIFGDHAGGVAFSPLNMEDINASKPSAGSGILSGSDGKSQEASGKEKPRRTVPEEEEAEKDGFRNIQSLLSSIGHSPESVNANKVVYLSISSALTTLRANLPKGPPTNAANSTSAADKAKSISAAISGNANSSSHGSQVTPATSIGAMTANHALSALANNTTIGRSASGAAPSPLHERSLRSPTVSDILRQYPSHPKTSVNLLDAKKSLLAFEVHAAEQDWKAAIAELGSCLRSMWGLFDHGNGAFRTLASLCIQKVLSELALSPAPSKNGKGAATYGVGIWHEAALADVFINMYGRTPELSIVALDKVISDREKAISGAIVKAVGKGASQPKAVEEEKQVHPFLQAAALSLIDPIPYLLRGAFKAKLGMWEAAIEDYNLAEAAEALWVERVPEIFYQRGICYSNMPGAMCRERSIQDLIKFLSMVEVDHRRVPDAHYTIAGNHFALKNVRLVVDHFAKALEAEAVRFPFLPAIINNDLKTRLTLEVKYALVIGGTHVRNSPWSKVPAKVLRMVEGEEPANSIAKECLACHALGRTRTCAGCLTARYCSTNCQVRKLI
ncbi:hypothetical protein HDU97_001963 [Phlyctochytrium planicorne]|nr:hypothetical protein HDU97_001963 [Phlyctochytrium planicorne]